MDVKLPVHSAVAMAGLKTEPVVYHPAPEDYSPPRECFQCGAMIYLERVIGGLKWYHIPEDSTHEVVLPKPWWDTWGGGYRTACFWPVKEDD